MTTTSVVEHPAEIIDTYLRVCADEDRFVAQSVAAFDTVGLNGPVLDCAVGTGFGTLRLLEAGYSLVCSDGSVDMLRRFRLDCAEAGLPHDAETAGAHAGPHLSQLVRLLISRRPSMGRHLHTPDAPSALGDERAVTGRRPPTQEIPCGPAPFAFRRAVPGRLRRNAAPTPPR